MYAHVIPCGCGLLWITTRCITGRRVTPMQRGTVRQRLFLPAIALWTAASRIAAASSIPPTVTISGGSSVRTLPPAIRAGSPRWGGGRARRSPRCPAPSRSSSTCPGPSGLASPEPAPRLRRGAPRRPRPGRGDCRPQRTECISNYIRRRSATIGSLPTAASGRTRLRRPGPHRATDALPGKLYVPRATPCSSASTRARGAVAVRQATDTREMRLTRGRRGRAE